MFKHRFIQKITAAIMVVVFAISITPTIVFHNWVAGHADTFTKATEQKGDQLGKQTFNCHCDHVVAESPFTEAAKNTISYPSLPFASVKAELQIQYLSSLQFLYSLRGPPAV